MSILIFRKATFTDDVRFLLEKKRKKTKVLLLDTTEESYLSLVLAMPKYSRYNT